MSDNLGALNEIKEIGKKIEFSIGSYFNRENLNDPTSNFDWEYILIDNDKIKNAWCMPGGKIAVYTGMLKVTKNTDGLAAVCLLYTSPSPRDLSTSRMPSSA